MNEKALKDRSDFLTAKRDKFQKYLMEVGLQHGTAVDYAQSLSNPKFRLKLRSEFGCDTVYDIEDIDTLTKVIVFFKGSNNYINSRIRNATRKYIDFVTLEQQSEELARRESSFKKYIIARGINEDVAVNYSKILASKKILDTLDKMFGAKSVYAITDVETLKRVSSWFKSYNINSNHMFSAAMSMYIDWINDMNGNYGKKQEEEKKSKPQLLTAEDELKRLDSLGRQRYCIGDIVDANGKPAKIFSIRPQMIQITDKERTDVGSRDINEILKSLCNLLQNGSSLVSTTPALAMLYGMVGMELDYALVRLNMDKRFLSEALFLTFGEKGWHVDYKAWAKKLEEAKGNWGYKEFKSTDNVCFTDPGFEYEQFLEDHETYWEILQNRLDAIISLLKEMHGYITKPDQKKIVNIYYMLESTYMRNCFPNDKEDYETFLIGVPDCNRNREIEGRILDLENDLNSSGFFDGFGENPTTARHMLWNTEKGDWDVESIAKHIFGQRKRLTEEIVYKFFRYSKMVELMKKDLIAEEKKSLPKITQDKGTVVQQPSNTVKELLAGLSENRPIQNINITVVNGHQITGDANIETNLGAIITKE